MNIRNTFGAMGLVAVTVAASLVAIGCNGEAAGTDLPTVGGSSVAASPTTAQNLPHLLGRRDRHLPAGVYLLDLAALDTTPAGRAHLPKIAITLPSGWQGYQGFAVTKDRGLTGVMGLSFWDVDQVYGTPCRWKSKGMVDPGTTIGGLAAALSRQPLRNARLQRTSFWQARWASTSACRCRDTSTSRTATRGTSRAGPGLAGRATAGSKVRAKSTASGS